MDPCPPPQLVASNRIYRLRRGLISRAAVYSMDTSNPNCQSCLAGMSCERILAGAWPTRGQRPIERSVAAFSLRLRGEDSPFFVRMEILKKLDAPQGVQVRLFFLRLNVVEILIVIVIVHHFCRIFFSYSYSATQYSYSLEALALSNGLGKADWLVGQPSHQFKSTAELFEYEYRLRLSTSTSCSINQNQLT